MIEHLPPHDVQAEEAVLASLMVAPEAVAEVRSLLTSADFFRERNGWVYEACLALWSRRESINEVTVAHELSENGRLEEVGGLPFLSRIITELPTPVGVEHYAGIVAGCALRRRLIGLAGEIARVASDGRTESVGAKVLALTMAVVNERAASSLHNLKAEVWDIATELKIRLTTPGYTGELSTGLPAVDAMLGGLFPGSLYVLAARTSKGKTAFLTHLGLSAMKAGAKAFTASLEMGAEQIWGSRVLAQHEARVNPAAYYGTRSASDAEVRAIDAAADRVSRWPGEWAMDDRPGLSVETLRAVLERQQAASGLDLVCVDYLQLMPGSRRRDGRVVELGEVSRGLKECARALRVPVVAAAQLSRAAETHPHPTLADLRESGSIEQDADVVLFLFECDGSLCREEKHKEAGPDSLWLRVEKNRHGARNDVLLRFRPNYMEFA